MHSPLFTLFGVCKPDTHITGFVREGYESARDEFEKLLHEGMEENAQVRTRGVCVDLLSVTLECHQPFCTDSVLTCLSLHCFYVVYVLTYAGMCVCEWRAGIRLSRSSRPRTRTRTRTRARARHVATVAVAVYCILPTERLLLV